MFRRLLILGLSATLAAGCWTAEPANPFDPNAPPDSQAKARIRGTLKAESLVSAQGLPIELTIGSRVVQQVSTASDGSFVFDALAPDRYVVRSTPTGFVPVSVPAEVRAGEDLDLGELLLAALAVSEQATLTGVASLEGESDHSGTLVEAVGRAYTAVTDTDGAWRLQLVPGSYTLRFTHKNFVTVSLEEVVVAPREERTMDALALPANPATIRGLVEAERADGSVGPLDAAIVSADGTGTTGLSNATGSFSLTGLPAGSYLVRVVKDGYVETSLPVLNLVGGETRDVATPLRLALARGALHGKVTLADSTDASGITVEATGTGRASVTDSSGRFDLDRLLVGPYELTARKDGYTRRVLGTFTVTEGGSIDAGTSTLARQTGALTVTQGSWTKTRQVTLQLQSPGATGFRVSEDPTFTNAELGDTTASAWRPYTANATHELTLTDRDGEHEITVVFFDGTTTSAPASASVVLDRQAPTAASLVIESGGGFTNAQTGIVTLTLGAQDLPAIAGATVSGLSRVHLADASTFAGGRTFDYTRTTTWTLADAAQDGRKSVWARFEDAAGNIGAPIEAVVVLDRIAPSSAAIALTAETPAAAGFALSPLVTATLTAVDANGGTENAALLVRLSHDPGFGSARFVPFEASTTWLLAPGDGEKTVYAQFLDPAGNQSLAVHASILLDTKAPTAPSVVVRENDGTPNDGVLRTTTTQVELSAAGTPVAAELSESPGFADPIRVEMASRPLPVTASFTFAGTGTRTIWARFFDAAGNTSAPANATVLIDDTAPAAAPVTLTPSPFTRTTTIALVPPAAGQQELQVTGDVVAPTGFVAAPADAPITITLTSGDGPKNLTVTYRDVAGNTTALPARSVTLDGTPPTAANFAVSGQLADGTASTTLSATRTVLLDFSTVADPTSGLARMLVSNTVGLSDASWQPFTAAARVPWTLSAGDGPKTVYAKFQDAAGNDSGIVQGTITLDGAAPTAPSITLVEQDERPSNGFTKSTAVTLQLNAAGTPTRAIVSESPGLVGGTTVNLVGQTLPYSTSFTLAGADGTHTVWARFYDAAGNASEVAAASVVLDRVAPAAATATLVPAAFTTTTAVQLVAPAAGQDEVQLAGAVTAPTGFVAAAAGATVAVTLTAGNGPKTLTPTWRDLAGNTTTAPALTITLDDAPPTAGPFTISGRLGDGSASTTLTATTGVTLDLSGQTDAASGIVEMKLSNLASLADASWAPFVASTAVPFNLSPGDGARIVYARFRDRAGLESSTVQGTITLRETPPSGGSLLIAGGAARTNIRTATLMVAATGASEMALSLDGFATAPTWVTYATSTSVDLGATDQRTVVVSARFRNAARVEGASASASIYYDATPPAAGTMTLVGSLGNGQTSTTITASPAMVVKLTAAGTDTADVALVQAASCVGAFASPAWQPFATSLSFVLSGADGTKKVCAIFRDASGNFNASAFASQDIVLDTTPPTNPAFTNVASTITNAKTMPPTGSAIITASTDLLSAVTYECLGGQYGPSWTACATNTTSQAAFILDGDRENTLGIRARDAAYNVSPGALVRVVQDSIPPLPPNITTVQTTVDSVSVSWTPSPSADVATYRLNYGTAPGDTTGRGADQGPSPVGVGASTAAQLTGLNTGNTYTVSAVAVDQAGNVSDPSGERVAVPNVVNPRIVSSFGGNMNAANVGPGTDEIYIAQNLGIVRINGSSDVTGRVTLPNFVPSRSSEMPIVSCNKDGVPGECVFVTGSTLEGDFRRDYTRYKAGIAVVFFPAGTSAAPSAGTTITTLSAPAERLHLVGTKLWALDAKELRQFDVSDPTRPALVNRNAFPSGETVTVMGSGIKGTRLYVLGRSAGSSGPSLWNFDLSSASLSATVQAGPRGSGGIQLLGGNFPEPIAAFHGGTVAVAYSSNGANGRNHTVCAYDPQGALYPNPASACVTVATNDYIASLSGATCGANGRLYAFLEKTSTPGIPQAIQLTVSGDTLTRAGDLGTAANYTYGSCSAWRVSASLDRLVAVELQNDWRPDADQMVHRWNNSSGTFAGLNFYVEPRGALMAHVQGTLVVAAGPKLQTLDVSNPLLPKLVSRTQYNRAGTWEYIALVGHGHLAYALANGSGGGVDVFRVLPDGGVGYVTTYSVANGTSLAVSGRFAYVGRGSSAAGVRAIDLSNGNVITGGTMAVTALAVRGQTIYAANSSGDFQTLTHAGGTITDLSSVATNPAGMSGVRHVRVAGTLATISDAWETYVVDVSSPSGPSFQGSALPLAGPVLLNGGYLVGNSPLLTMDRSPNGVPESGIRFGVYTAGFASPQVDGTTPFATCGAQSSSVNTSLETSQGLYFAPCNRNGILLFAAASQTGGSLLKRIDGPWSTSGPLATDGMYTFSGARYRSSTYNTLWSANEQYIAYSAGYPFSTQPTYLFNPTSFPSWLNAYDGQLTATLAASPPQIAIYDATRPQTAGGYTLRGTYNLTLTGTPPDAPVTDGDYLYVVQEASGLNNTRVTAVDVRAATAPVLASATSGLATQAFKSLAVQRQRMFIGRTTSGVPDIAVYNVQTPTAPAALTAVTFTTPPTEIHDLAAMGRHLFFVGSGSAYEGPYTLGVVKLGTNRDGSGAVQLATFFTSPLPLGNPTVVGDTLYVRHNMGIASFDLTPLWTRDAAPVYLGSQGSAEATWKYSTARMLIDGPWAYVLGDSYRVYDLR